MVVAIILFILILGLTAVLIKLHLDKKYLLNCFAGSSTITYGTKGKGKGLIFQYVIYHNRKKSYYCNIDYGYKYNNIKVKDITLAPNTFANLINDNISIVNKVEKMENRDIYIDDAGMYLPSHLDTLLTKTYPSFPLYYCVPRHLYNQNIHLNTQALNRVWIKIREQADFYISCRKTIKLPFCLVTKCFIYDKYETATANILPYKSSALNNHDKALKKQFDATNGVIKTTYHISWKKNIKYDTRVFHKKFFGFAVNEKKEDF